MTKDTRSVLALLIIVVAIAVFPLLTITDSVFGGTDSVAKEIVAVIDPDYVPWAESIIKLPGGEMESFMFSLQAAIGAGIFCFGFGYLVARKKYQKGV